MNKLLILCCINIISVIYAAPAPLKSDASINDILQQLEFLKECPAVLKNNIGVLQLNGGLSHCKNVSIANPPQQIDLVHLNDFYCVGLLAADIQLCSGNKTNKIPKNYDDLKTSIDKIKTETSEKTCNELNKLNLFIETENVTNLKKWIEVLNKTLHDQKACVGLCTDTDSGNTNLFCAMWYYINNNISYVTIIPEKMETPKLDANNKDAQQKTPASTVLKDTLLNEVVGKAKPTKTESQPSAVQVQVTAANIKDNSQPLDTTKQEQPVVNAPSKSIIPPLVINQAPPEKVAVEKPQKETPVATEATTATKNVTPVQKDEQPVAEVKNVQITEEAKQTPVVINQIPVAEENQKNPTLVETSSVSSTVNGARDDLGEEYFEEVEDINKENEDQLLPQTNVRKETIEILTNDQDRHRMPSEEGDDMEESNFFSYFMFVSVMFIAGYVVYHNKQKIMALLLEGRRDRNSRRRPNTASYRKLNSNLEEAVTSKCSGSASHVIY